MLTSGKSYSNVFHKNGGNASFSVMANTLRGVYGTDVLIAASKQLYRQCAARIIPRRWPSP